MACKLAALDHCVAGLEGTRASNRACLRSLGSWYLTCRKTSPSHEEQLLPVQVVPLGLLVFPGWCLPRYRLPTPLCNVVRSCPARTLVNLPFQALGNVCQDLPSVLAAFPSITKEVSSRVHANPALLQNPSNLTPFLAAPWLLPPGSESLLPYYGRGGRLEELLAVQALPDPLGQSKGVVTLLYFNYQQAVMAMNCIYSLVKFGGRWFGPGGDCCALGPCCWRSIWADLFTLRAQFPA